MERRTLISFLDDCARHGKQTAAVGLRGLRPARWSYLDLRRAALQFAAELESRSVERGDRVLVWAANMPEWLAAFFGCLARGAIVVPLDGHSAADFVARVQRQVAAKLLLADRETRRRARLDVPVFDLESLAEIVARHDPSAVRPIDAEPGDLIEIIFTSGTTAEPKGVCLTHRNLLANLAPIEREIPKYMRYERPFHPIRFLNLLPLSHVFGQFMGIFIPQLLGGEVYFQDSLNPSEIIATTRRHRISVIAAVPRQLETLRDKIERNMAAAGRREDFAARFERAAGKHVLRRWWMFRDVHRRFGWKFWAFVSGGATLDAETETFWQRLGYAVIQGYGMTETASLITVNHPFKMSRGSIGKTLPGHEVKLDASGEILVRGENISPGYWEGGLRPLTADEGWLRTGDIGERDAEGNLFFKGRKKDVIVTAAGLNIYPEDLEAALNRQPEVRDSAVIAVDMGRGPEPLAVLLLRDEAADAADIVERANRELAEPQRMRHWFVWRQVDFPRTTTQKIVKRAVAATVLAESGTQPITESAAPAGALAEVVASVSGASRIDPQARLAADLKLDSLGRVELLSAIEDRFQVELDEAAFNDATTLADIEKMLAGEKAPAAPRYPYPRWARRFPATWIRFIAYYLLIWPLTLLMCPARVVGRERLRGLRGPALFISNHVTMADPALVLWALPPRFRHRLAVAMEGERLLAFRHPPRERFWLARLWMKAQYVLLVTLFNVFPLPQKSGFRRSFAFLGEAIDEGWSVLVFPEGRLTEDGKMRPFMSGAGVLAVDLDVPVAPIYIEGLFALRERRQYFSRPGAVTLRIGDPLEIPSGLDAPAAAGELRARVEELSGEAGVRC